MKYDNLTDCPKQSKETIIWHPGNKPKEFGRYLVTEKIGGVEIDRYRPGIGWDGGNEGYIIAWAEIPKGWKPQ